MMMRSGHARSALAAVVIGPVIAAAACAEPAPLDPEIDSSDGRYAYRQTDTRTLHLHALKPKTGGDDRRAAMIYFHGGGWDAGGPQQLARDAAEAAERGIVGLVAEYRLVDGGDITVAHCISDAMHAIAWTRDHAGPLGIDPDRIVLVGASAGGYLAAATVFFDRDPSTGEPAPPQPRPLAMVLFNPVVDTTERGWGSDRLGDRAEELSVIEYVAADAPPTIIFHGDQDQLVPVENVQRYARLMEERGNRCDLHVYRGQGHGFFNFRPNHPEMYRATRQTMWAFLDEFGVGEAAVGR
jgi:acetyl esterase